MEIACNRSSPLLPETANPGQQTDQVEKCTHHCRGITALPSELVEKILANLGPRDLLVCKRVTTRWTGIIDILLSRPFYRHLHPLAPVPELPTTINRHYPLSHWPSIRHWLECFGEPGPTLALELDGLVGSGTRLFPERLFFSLAKLLAETPVFHCRKVCTIPHTNSVRQANFSPDGRYLITASVEPTAKVCERVDGQWQEVATLAHVNKVFAVIFSPTGDYCITVCWSYHTIHIWERGQAGVGKPWQSHVTLPHSSFVEPCFSGDGNYLFTAPTETTTEILQPVNGRWTRQTTLLNGHGTNGALFHPREHLLATVHDHSKVYIWQLVDNQWKNQAILSHPNFVPHIHFSPDGNRLLVQSNWPTPTQRYTVVHIYNRARAWFRETDIPRLGTRCTTRFSPDGNMLVILSHTPDAVSIWRFSNQSWLKLLLPQVNPFTNARFSPDGNQLVTPTRNNTVVIWRKVNGQWQEQTTLLLGKDDAGWVLDSHFSPHGHHLVTIPSEGEARIWGIVDGHWQEKSCSTLGGANTGHFSPDGLYFVACDWSIVNIWTIHQELP